MQMQRDDDPATKRILARRARDAERTKKLHNSRLRNVGADIAGIKAQIQAKQEVKRAQQEDDRSYMNNQEAVRRYLTSVEQEAWQLQHAEAIALRADWSTQSSTRGDRIEADLAIPVTQIPATHAETCSLGAAQLFDGEDTMKKERLRLQALQLRKWTEAQKMEKSAKSAQAKQEDMAFAATLKEVVSYQEDQQAAMERRKTYHNATVRDVNATLMEEKKIRHQQEDEMSLMEEARDVTTAASSALLTEDPQQGVSVVSPTRVRPDHWKGMPKSQVLSILKGNDTIMEKKQADKDSEKVADMDYAAQQRYYQHCMEENEFGAQVHVKAMDEAVTTTLAAQRIQAQEREAKQKALSRGSINKGFFDGFGTSYR